MARSQRHILIILDGYGIAEDPSVSAIDRASKPFLDMLFDKYPHSTLEASGLAVGLPEGQMGNSEVGHTNLGAGRVVYQEITRIDKAISEGDFFDNEVLVHAARRARDRGRKLHLLGLLSDGGVHSQLGHVEALLKLAAREGLESDSVLVHAFTDGRDTAPNGGVKYVRALEEIAAAVGVGRVATVVGRYFAMDRDNRWPRIEKAYDALVRGVGQKHATATAALEASYASGTTDEFVEPCVIGDRVSESRIRDGDSVVFFNFRSDRARQISRALALEPFESFERTTLKDLYYATMTPYDQEFSFPVAFPKVNLKKTLGEIVSSVGSKQLRAAETEKYPHVTYFFNGGREDPFDGESRVLAPSPKVATYDLQPEMSAVELSERVAEAIRTKENALVILNFANPDMVGHTGVFDAAVKAVETIDSCTKTVVEAALECGYSVEIIADHGNADKMINPDGTPHTAHTTALVPHLLIADNFAGPIRPGKLGDVAPTILSLLGIDIPEEMTGDVLV